MGSALLQWLGGLPARTQHVIATMLLVFSSRGDHTVNAIHVGGLRRHFDNAILTLQRAERELLRGAPDLAIAERIRLLQAKLRGVSVVVNNLAFMAAPHTGPLPLLLRESSHLDRARPLARNNKGYAPTRRTFLTTTLIAIAGAFVASAPSINETQITEGAFYPTFTEGGIVSFEYTTRDLQTLSGREVVVPLPRSK